MLRYVSTSISNTGKLSVSFNLETEIWRFICKFSITFPTKVWVVKATGFSSSHVQMWELDYKECWVPKNWCFLWCWRKLMRVPWTARRSNQWILEEINPEYLLEGLMLKLQYFGHVMRRADSLERTLTLGRIKGRRRRGQQRMRRLVDITNSMDISWSKFQEIVKDREAWHATVHGVAKSQTGLSDWTATNRPPEFLTVEAPLTSCQTH